MTTFKSQGEPEVYTAAKRSRKEQLQSLKQIMKYARQQTCLLSLGIIFLLLGNVGDFVVPYYVGMVIDALTNSD